MHAKKGPFYMCVRYIYGEVISRGYGCTEEAHSTNGLSLGPSIHEEDGMRKYSMVEWLQQIICKANSLGFRL
jgi:hypothetical protein